MTINISFITKISLKYPSVYILKCVVNE